MFPAWSAFDNRALADLEITHRPLNTVPRTSRSVTAIYDPLLLRDVRMVEEVVAPCLSRRSAPDI